MPAFWRIPLPMADSSVDKRKAMHLFSLGVSLLVLWLVLSGHYTGLLISLGVASVLLVVYVAHRMDVADEEGHPVHLSFRAPLFWLYLLWEIVKANLDVARRILSRDPGIEPELMRVRASQKTSVGRVTYANAITLTPGTVSIDVDGEYITVHALTREGADALRQGDMDRQVTRMEDAP